MNDANKNISVWIATTPKTQYPTLQEDKTTDAVVVGGGIAGLSTAILLKQKGVKVILIEAGRIVEKTTGNTTAKLTSLHGLKYARLLQNFTEEGVKMYADANQEAISCVNKLVDEYKITCDCLTTDAYTYAITEKDKALVEDEAKAAKQLGLPAKFIIHTPLPFQTYGAVQFTKQLQFHVRKYLLGIAKALEGKGCNLFEQTKALDVTKDGDKYIVITDKGTIKTTNLVIATHKPFYDPDKIYANMPAFRDYALGVLLDESTPQGMYFSTGDDPYSIRYQPTKDGDIIILGGGWFPEKTATNPDKHLEEQRQRYAKLFKIKAVKYKWFTHDYILDDEVPSIGRLSTSLPHIYVATAFAGWGMTTGVAAGMILSDLIINGKNPWSKFFDFFERNQFTKKTPH